MPTFRAARPRVPAGPAFEPRAPIALPRPKSIGLRREPQPLPLEATIEPRSIVRSRGRVWLSLSIAGAVAFGALAHTIHTSDKAGIATPASEPGVIRLLSLDVAWRSLPVPATTAKHAANPPLSATTQQPVGAEPRPPSVTADAAVRAPRVSESEPARAPLQASEAASAMVATTAVTNAAAAAAPEKDDPQPIRVGHDAAASVAVPVRITETGAQPGPRIHATATDDGATAPTPTVVVSVAAAPNSPVETVALPEVAEKQPITRGIEAEPSASEEFALPQAPKSSGAITARRAPEAPLSEPTWTAARADTTEPVQSPSYRSTETSVWLPWATQTRANADRAAARQPTVAAFTKRVPAPATFAARPGSTMIRFAPGAKPRSARVQSKRSTRRKGAITAEPPLTPESAQEQLARQSP